MCGVRSPLVLAQPFLLIAGEPLATPRLAPFSLNATTTQWPRIASDGEV